MFFSATIEYEAWINIRPGTLELLWGGHMKLQTWAWVVWKISSSLGNCFKANTNNYHWRFNYRLARKLCPKHLIVYQYPEYMKKLKFEHTHTKKSYRNMHIHTHTNTLTYTYIYTHIQYIPTTYTYKYIHMHTHTSSINRKMKQMLLSQISKYMWPID